MNPTPYLLAAVLMVACLALASHSPMPPCDSDGYPALGVIQIGSGRADDPNPTIYIDDRNYVLGNGVWIYMESNGRDGLQRGGSSAYVPDDSEVCYDDKDSPPDTLII